MFLRGCIPLQSQRIKSLVSMLLPLTAMYLQLINKLIRKKNSLAASYNLTSISQTAALVVILTLIKLQLSFQIRLCYDFYNLCKQEGETLNLPQFTATSSTAMPKLTQLYNKLSSLTPVAIMPTTNVSIKCGLQLILLLIQHTFPLQLNST